MAKEYQWRSALAVESGGYPGEPHGSSGDTGWVTGVIGESGSHTSNYWYADSDVLSTVLNQDMSIVTVAVSQTWTTSVDAQNNLTVTVTTTINSIERVSYGNPGTNPRDIDIKQSPDGGVFFTTTEDPINTTHTILGTPLAAETYSFTIAPGGDFERSSIWYRNHSHGRPWTEPYLDIFGIGVRFMNPLPADYVPGETWNGATWLSHNRTGGTANIRTGSNAWTQMRTIDGGVGGGNPPLIRHDSDWKNMRLIGQE